MDAIHNNAGQNPPAREPQSPSLWKKATTAVTSGIEKAAVAFSRKVGRVANKLSSTPTGEEVRPGRTILSATQFVDRQITSAGEKVVSGSKKVVSAARKTKAFITSKKTRAFFTQGVIGKKVGLSTGLGAAQAALGLAGGWVVAGPAGLLGQAIGSGVGATLIPIAAAGAGAVAIRRSQGQLSLQTSFQHLRELSVAKGIVTISALFALIGAQWQYGHSLQEQGEVLGKISFEFLGSFITSVIASYQVSRLSSGLSFAEYATNNIYQVATTMTLDTLFPTGLLVRVPRNLVLGMAAYNAVPLSNLIKTMHKFLNADSKKRKDLAFTIKYYVEERQKQALEAAIKARDEAALKGEDPTEHNKKVKDLQEQSFGTRTLFNILDNLLRSGFKTFNDYQAILSSSDIGEKQAKFIEIYRQAGKFEQQLLNEGIKATDDYQAAHEQNPIREEDLATFTTRQKNYYAFEKSKVKDSLCSVLNRAVAPTSNGIPLLGRMQQGIEMAVQAGIRKASRGYLTPQLDNILPDIHTNETIFLGFAITDSINSEIANELIKIHMHYFTILSGVSLVSGLLSEGVRSLIPASIRPAAAERTPLKEGDDLDLVEGLLKLAMNHYKRIDGESPLIQITETILKGIFTSLRAGPTAALAEWRRGDEGFEDLSEATEAPTPEEAASLEEEPVIVTTPDEDVRRTMASPTPSNSSLSNNEDVERGDATVVDLTGANLDEADFVTVDLDDAAVTPEETTTRTQSFWNKLFSSKKGRR
jgi:hypothetical protein